MAERVTQDDAAQLLTYAEAARLLSVSERTLARYISDQKVTVVRLPSGSPRIRRVDLDAMVDGGAA
jgi:excisionase family DNA binding protein